MNRTAGLAEPPSRRALTAGQRHFVAAFLRSFDAVEAAVASGIPASEARHTASALLLTPAVTASIAQALAERARRAAGAGRQVRDMLARKTPLRSGLRRLAREMVARAGFRLERVTEGPGAGAGQPLLHVHHEGRCFYCLGESPISRRLLAGGAWDAHFKRILLERAGQGKTGTVVEVGANIGATFLPISAGLPQFRFVMIEPVREFYDVLEMNRRSFGAENVVLHHMAVSDGRADHLLLIVDNVSAGVSAAGVMRNRFDARVQQAVALDNLFPHDNIAMLKADVDGFEIDVLKGAKALLRRSRPDILLEFNPFAMEVRGIDPLELLALLTEVGADTFTLYSDDGQFLETTADPKRVLAAHRALKRPQAYADLHAAWSRP